MNKKSSDTGSKRVSRRRLLGSVGAAGLVGLAGCSGDGGDGDGDGGDDTATATATETSGGDGTTQATTTGSAGGASGTVRIGVIQPLTGDLRYYGQQAIWGFASGLAYKTDTDPVTDLSVGTRTVEADDVTYELLLRDTQLAPSTAQSRATDLVTDEGVDFLFGPTSSGAAEQVVSSVVKQSGTPIMVGPAASTSITSNSEFCDPNVFRASENVAMDARSGGRFAAQNTDIERVFLMGADYSFGQSVVANYRSVFEEEGIEIVGEQFVPQGYDSFDGLFQQAVEAGAQGVVGGFTVSTLPQFMTTAANYDVRIFGGFATEITNSIVGNVLGNLLGTPLTAETIREAEIGPFTTRYHWNQYDNPINDAFVDTYTDAYGKVPDLFTSGTFTAASAIAQGVSESGSTAGADIAEAIRGMTVTDTPKGENAYQFQEYNNQARSAMTVAYPVPSSEDLGESWGASIMPQSPPAATVGMESTTIPEDSDMMNCSL
jgi:branched-chain amino acid transport system substrate-binding protein